MVKGRAEILAELIMEQFGPIDGEMAGVSSEFAAHLARSWLSRLQLDATAKVQSNMSKLSECIRSDASQPELGLEGCK